MRIMETYNVLKTLFERRTGPLLREGHELTERDNSTARDAYLSLLCVLCDLEYLNLEEHKADAGRIISDLMTSDLKDVLTSLAESYSLVQRCSVTGFKALIHSISPTLWKKIRNDVEQMGLGDAVAARRLLQVTALPSRLSLKDISFEQEAITDYLNIEESIVTDYPTSIVQSLNRIIKFWLKDFDPSNIQFRHGSGSVAFISPPTLETKYSNMGTDRKISIVFKDTYHPTVETLLSLPSTDAIVEIDRRSETTFVPKSWKSMRTISMESPTLMYLQQGVLAAIDQMVERSTYLRNRIGTHDQTRNQKLAMEASIFRNYATIDLSAASDSVAWDLVKQVFKGTKLYPYLIATRSTHTVLPNGDEVELKKFAPMGSALCFPIETIIFASICELVTRRWQHNCGETGRFSGRFSVYGDDIICPTECAEDVLDVLSVLGFRPNSQKSFWREGDWYRESCGIECIDGVDVTPYRLSRNFEANTTTQGVSVKADRFGADEVNSGVTGFVDGANAAELKGYQVLRCFFIQKLVEHGYTPLFGESGVRSTNPTNFHTQRRYNANIQRTQVRASAFVPRNKRELLKARGDEAIAYRHWLERAHYRQMMSASDQAQTVTRSAIVRVRNEVLRFNLEIFENVSPTNVGPPPRRNLAMSWFTI